MGPQIILAMSTPKSNRHYIVVAVPAQSVALRGVTAVSTQPVIRRVRSPAAQRSPFVLFAPPQQQWRLLHSGASFLLRSVRPHFQYIHAHRVPFEFSTTPTTIVTINQTIHCFAVFYSDRHGRLSLRR
jgi:hypothetical protein